MMMIRKRAFVVALCLLLPGVSHAQSPCTPASASGVTDFYELEVAPFQRTYEVSRPLRIPLAQPVTRDVSVLRFYVVIEEKDPAAAWFDALNNLWNAAAEGAAQEAIRKIRTRGSPERALFLARCTPAVDRYMQANRIADKKIRYVTPRLEPQLPGNRPLHTCTFVNEQRRQMQARLYHRVVTEQKQEWEREIGEAAISFKLIVEGDVDDRPAARLRFDASDLVVQPRLSVSDTDPHIVNLKTAAMRLEAESALNDLLRL